MNHEDVPTPLGHLLIRAGDSVLHMILLGSFAAHDGLSELTHQRLAKMCRGMITSGIEARSRELLTFVTVR